MGSHHILHVVNIYFVLPYFIGDQFRFFSSKGDRLYVACSPSEYLAEYAEQQGFEYIETSISRTLSLRKDIRAIFVLCRYIKKKDIDIIVGHTPKGGLLAMIAGWIMRVPSRIYFRHGLVYETSYGIKRFVLKMVDRITSFCATKIVCVSPSVLTRSIKDHLAPSSKQVILGKGTCNGVDTAEMFNPEFVDQDKVLDNRGKYGINNGDYVIGYTGRLVKDKGIIDLLNAFDLLKDADNCKLLLVGMFEERDSLPEDVKERILNDKRIVYTGFINGGMQYYYALMNVYVLPSYREGFPTGVLEAQSMGLPVVTTRVTGCCDSIVEGKTGLFVSHDSKSIAEGIDAIRIDHAIDGQEGRKWVVENFDSRVIWKEIEKLYSI